MSEILIALVQQIIIMFILSAAGYFMFKTNKIDMNGNKALANILIYLSLPCVIVNGFLVDRTTENIKALLVSAGIAVIILCIAVLISKLFFPKDEIAKFAATFSNPGFFGVPIIIALLGKESVFYIAMFIAMLNLLQWTYGVSILTGKTGKISMKQVIKAPFMIALIIGLIIFFTQLPVPTVITKSIDFIAGVNTPIAMFTIGVYFAHVDIKKMLKNVTLLKISVVRQLLIPLVSIAVLSLIPSTYTSMKLALLIAAGCPVGSNVTVYAQLHQKNYSYAVETVIISSLLSIVSLPLIVFIALRIW